MCLSSRKFKQLSCVACLHFHIWLLTLRKFTKQYHKWFIGVMTPLILNGWKILFWLCCVFNIYVCWMISGISTASWEVLSWGTGIFSLAVSLQYSCEYDDRISSMAFNIYITWWISGFAEVLKQDSARGKASSKGVVLYVV